jgi:hypothetical protein
MSLHFIAPQLLHQESESQDTPTAQGCCEETVRKQTRSSLEKKKAGMLFQDREREREKERERAKLPASVSTNCKGFYTSEPT